MTNRVQGEENSEQAIRYRNGRHRGRTCQLAEECQYENDELLDSRCGQDRAAGIGKIRSVDRQRADHEQQGSPVACKEHRDGARLR